MVVSPLKGQCHEIFCSVFFRESFPQASDNSIRGISNFFGDRCTTGINDTSGKFSADVNYTGGK